MSARPKRASATKRDGARSSNTAWRWWTVGAAICTAVIVWLSTKTFLAVFRLRGDDYSLVRNSANGFIDGHDVAAWFTQGYAHYFWNYPEWPSRGFEFSRPVMNLAIYAQSLVAPALGEVAYLVMNYAALVAMVVLTMQVFRRNSDVAPPMAAVISVAVGLSPAFYDALFFPSFGTNTLAAVFSVAALLVLEPSRSVPARSRRIGVIVLVSLAILSHETAVVVPVVLALLLYGMAPDKPRLRDVLFLAVPLAVFLLARVLVGLGASNYVSSAEGVEMLVLRVTNFIVGPLVPFNSVGFKIQARPLPLGAAVPFYLGVVANVAAIGALAMGLWRTPRRRSLALVGALLVAVAPGFWMYGDPRFMAFSLVVSLTVLLHVTSTLPRWRIAVVSLLVISQIALLNVGLAGDAGRRAGVAMAGGSYFDGIKAAIERENPDTVVLVNDRQGGNGALAMLQMAAWPRVDERELVVVNGIAGPPDPAASTEVSTTPDGALAIQSTFAPGQSVDFAGCVEDFSRRHGGFTYEWVVPPVDGQGGTLRAVRQKAGGVVLVVGEDPATGQPLLEVFR